MAGDADLAALPRSLFAAEQALLVVRLAADSAARRGEIAALRLGDLDGRVLTIERNLSQGVLGSTKSSRTRRLTLGATTAALITGHVSVWCERWPVAPVDDWLFSPDPTRATLLRADVLSHRMQRLGVLAGVPGAALHRLRHGVATHLVEGKLLKAQARLGHRDPATTLRHYAHAVALDDLDVADELDRILNGPSETAVA
jgi:integrase